MSILHTLSQRSNNHCELCQATEQLDIYEVPPVEATADKCILVCATCHNQLGDTTTLDSNHWRCLSEAMWSSVPAVQVTAYRQLKRLTSEPWAQDNLDMLYLEDDIKTWAEAGLATAEATEPTLDAHGTALQAGDNVTIIKDLVVKGAGFTAKRGTAVRNISLTDDPKLIEGRVNGTRIVLVSAYLKKL